MYKYIGTVLLALFTMIMWSAALIGTASGWLMRRSAKVAWLLGFVSAAVVFAVIWREMDWLPIRSVWEPYKHESDLVVILGLSFVAGCYAHASALFLQAYGGATKRRHF